MTTKEKLNRVRAILQSVDAWPSPPEKLLEKAILYHRERQVLHRRWPWLFRKTHSYVIEITDGRCLALSPALLEAFDSYCIEQGTMSILRGELDLLDVVAEENQRRVFIGSRVANHDIPANIATTG